MLDVVVNSITSKDITVGRCGDAETCYVYFSNISVRVIRVKGIKCIMHSNWLYCIKETVDKKLKQTNDVF